MESQNSSPAIDPEFQKAKYTAIISDLHLCEEEPVHPKYPLWKKYKTREFFFDEDLRRFFEFIEKKAQGEKIELVLAGDVFDFDSVMSIPKHPSFAVTSLEQKRGLFPQEEKSVYKIQKILQDHQVFIEALRDFLARGHRVIFIVGNHDLELHYRSVQDILREALVSTPETHQRLRFVEWFYISNQDTLIEHGNQYDPYCAVEDPVSPFILKFNKVHVRIPFGNLATRYMINGMGFFNPYLESNFIMSFGEYVRFFFKYIIKAQPFLLFTWFSGAVLILIQASFEALIPPLRDPMEIEGRIEDIARRSNATPRMVREMRTLTVPMAASQPILILRELWLDRAFIVLLAFFAIIELYLFISHVFHVSLFWTLIPFLLFSPFFIFYSRSISSDVEKFKEPQERILSLESLITKVSRVVHGHTHIVRHEMIGPVEHLNSGTWSPAFKDVECQEPVSQKTYVWIEPENSRRRRASIYCFLGEEEKVVFARGGKKSRLKPVNAKQN